MKICKISQLYNKPNGKSANDKLPYKHIDDPQCGPSIEFQFGPNNGQHSKWA